MSCSRAGEILGDRQEEKPVYLLLIHRKIKMDLWKYFSEVFMARIAKQKRHHDTELAVNTHLIWIAVLSGMHSENVCQDFIHQEIPLTHLRGLVH